MYALVGLLLLKKVVEDEVKDEKQRETNMRSFVILVHVLDKQ